MYNNTLNEDDYKEAVRSKFEKEKDGIYSNYLNNPSQANLRDLCWKIFKSNENTDDLNAYSDFFKFKFDSNNEDTSTTYTDKFKKVGRFFKGETKPAKIDTINFAAVLVDFEFRPFGKFKKHYTNDQKNAEEENDLKDEIETVQESEIESEVKKEDSIQREKLNEEENSWKKENLDKTALFNEEDKLIGDNRIPKEEGVLKEFETTQVLKPVELFLGFKDESKERNGEIKWNKWFGIGILSFLGLLVYYYFAQKNECMQWSGDHYEEVSCDLKIQGIGTYNVVKPFDERIINLRKIQVCDTTTFFKNGEAIIWYAKIGDSVEFFNTHGMHPEQNKKSLKPVTQYIIDKYVKDRSCKLTDKKINDL
ncbi:hypothetical protein [Flavobacterium ajazii]|uniref:hypothetical protein n=1 Tax=Flavobacterium ajazii TaxID=2692318 RepID=UPI0013D24597|nr:hypothetical protein [Flavobacterium ajazii]